MTIHYWYDFYNYYRVYYKFYYGKLFNTRWWDYSEYKFSIRGRVCLKNSFLF
ncbi:putative ABC transporter permease [Clostridium subterminale]|uniref:putative ABC transporter permease n=1 Tax=Clostridium subterminale TaxID=1550 RepID=UPI003CD09979